MQSHNSVLRTKDHIIAAPISNSAVIWGQMFHPGTPLFLLFLSCFDLKDSLIVSNVGNVGNFPYGSLASPLSFHLYILHALYDYVRIP